MAELSYNQLVRVENFDTAPLEPLKLGPFFVDDHLDPDVSEDPINDDHEKKGRYEAPFIVLRIKEIDKQTRKLSRQTPLDLTNSILALPSTCRPWVMHINGSVHVKLPRSHWFIMSTS